MDIEELRTWPLDGLYAHLEMLQRKLAKTVANRDAWENDPAFIDAEDTNARSTVEHFAVVITVFEQEILLVQRVIDEKEGRV